MSKIKLTKNELKKQKDSLKRFKRYLPTLQLKKQQLQLEIIKIQKNLEDYERKIEMFKSSIGTWIDVFAEDVNIKEFFCVKEVHTSEGNIAGVDIPIFEGIDFKEEKYDFNNIPLWVDFGIDALKEIVTLRINHEILQKQMTAVKEELRTTTQRVNLFEKVKIPEAQESIRKIQIYVGDMQTAAVVIGKIAKEKIQKKTQNAVLV